MSGHEEIGRLRLGVSACLLGRPVRYDGRHKRDPYLADVLCAHADLVPVCPELEAGLGVPREPMRLEGDPAAPRLVAASSRADLTDVLRAYAARRVSELACEDLWGFVLKSRSPSCGAGGIEVHAAPGGPGGAGGVGLFAKALMDAFPLLPVQEESRLRDPGGREHFIERIFCLRRWQDARRRLLEGKSLAPVVEYHSRHKYLLLSHSTVLARELGAVVGVGANRPPLELARAYEGLLTRALGQPATPAGHVNALTHVMGHLKRVLSRAEKTELLESFELFRQGLTPLATPMALLRRHAKAHGEGYLLSQVYLDPHPVELLLRNHA